MEKQLNTAGGENRFRFQSFNERIKSLKLNPAHKVIKQDTDGEPEEWSSLFCDALASWKELNCTTHFAHFCYEINPKISSLAQILYFKQDIIGSLCRHLLVENSLALEPLLELVTVLAKDLQLEFYPFFTQVAKIIIKLSDSSDSKCVEWSFNSIASLMKTLSKHVTRDIISVYTTFIPHLSSKKPHIRVFSAEALGFIIRKIKAPAQLATLFKHIFQTLSDMQSEYYCRGVSTCLFECVKNVNESVHSSASYIIHTILDTLQSFNTRLDSMESQAVMQMNTMIIHHLSPTNYEHVFNIIMTYEEKSKQGVWYIRLLMLYCMLKKGYLIPNRKPVFAICLKYLLAVKETDAHAMIEAQSKSLTQMLDVEESMLTTCVQFAATLFYTSSLEFSLIYGLPLLTEIFTLSPTYVFHFSELLRRRKWTHYSRIIVPHLISYIGSRDTEIYGVVVHLERIVGDAENFAMIPDHFKKNQMIMFKKGAFVNAFTRDLIENLKNVTDDQCEERFEKLCVYLNVLKKIRCENADLDRVLSNVLKDIFSFSGEYTAKRKEFVGCFVDCWSLRISICSERAAESYLYEQIMNLLDSVKDNVIGLTGLLSCLKRVKSNQAFLYLFSTERFLTIYPIIENCIGRNNPAERILIIEIARLFEMEQLVSSEVSSYVGPCPLFELFSEVENIIEDVATLRQKAASLRKIQTLAISRTLPMKYYACIASFMVANFSSRFTPYVNEVASVFGVLCGEFVQLWPKFWSALLRSRQVSYYIIKENKLTIPVHKSDELPHAELQLIYVDEVVTKFNRLDADITNNMNVPEATEVYHCDESIVYTNLLKSLLKIPTSDLLFRDVPQLFVTAYAAYNDSTSHKKLARIELIELLHILSNTPKLQKCLIAGEIYASFHVLVGNSDAAIQKPALKCLLKYHPEVQGKYAQVLGELIGEDSFRDALSMLDMKDMKVVFAAEQFKAIVEILCRILYAKVVSKKGKSSKSGLKQRRIAIFAFICSWDEKEVGVFMKLMHLAFTDVVPHVKTRIGYLHVAEDFIRQLKSRVEPFIPTIMSTLFKIATYENVEDSKMEIDNAVEEEEEDEDKGQDSIVLKRHARKEIRQHILKRFKQMFELPISFNFDPYSDHIIEHFIISRLENFENENSQGSSALLELIHTWTQHKKYLKYLLWNNVDIFKIILSVLSAKKVQKEVVVTIIDMLEHILEFSLDTDENGHFNAKTLLIVPNIPTILQNIKSIFNNPIFSEGSNLSAGNPLTRSIKIIARLSCLVTDRVIGIEIMDMLLPFLKKSSNVAPELIKQDVLIIFESFIPSLELNEDALLESTYFKVLSALFASLYNVEARQQLAKTFSKFSTLMIDLEPVTSALMDLNTYTLKKLDSRDFGKMFDAFNVITDNLIHVLDHLRVLPILHNLVFSIHDEAEYSVRTSAAHALRLFISRATLDQTSPLMTLVEYNLFPGIKKGIRFAKEASRQEFVQLLGHIVETACDNPMFSDMKCLLGNGDDEINFFSNIYHIQSHRRSRAIRRFSEKYTCLSVSNISNVIIPILIHYIFESDKTSDHQITNDSINSLGECAQRLPWGQYHALLKRFLYNISKKPNLEKVMIRTTVSIVDKFHFKMYEAELPEPVEQSLEEETEEDMGEVETEVIIGSESTARIHTVVVEKIIPELQRHLAIEHDETISVRVPVAESIARLLKFLPEFSMDIQLPKLLLKLCNLLKSRLQDTRDVTRDVLVKIQLILGPKYLFFLLNELQTALTRGYQLHVLGWSANAIITGLIPSLNGRTEEIDLCVELIMKILVNDLFSDVGNERDVEDLKGKMKEIKTTKSFQTCELLASSISIVSIGKMMLPLKELMLESKEAKVISKIDEVLRCFSIGLSKNKNISTQELLKFIYGLLNESLPIYQLAQSDKKQKNDYHHVKLGRPSKENTLKYFQANIHRFLEYGLNLLLQIIRLEQFDRQDMQILGMFDSLVDLLCRLLYSKHDTVVTLSIRCFSFLLKQDLPQMIKLYPVIIKQCFQIISTNRARDSPLMQNMFKFIVAVIRDKKDVTITNKQLGALLSLLKLDLEEADRHTTSFSLIKAIVSRKMVIEELYDVMDSVALLMVTSHIPQIRELARFTFVQFLIDYPQGEQRLKKQIQYVLKNMNYEFETGRISILETVLLLIQKFNSDILGEYFQILFLSLVMQMINDESSKCRDMSSVLIKTLLEKCEPKTLSAVYELLNGWYDSGRSILRRATMQVYGIMAESLLLDKSNCSVALKRINASLSDTVQVMKSTAWSEDTEESIEECFPEWDSGYYSIITFEKLMHEHRHASFSYSEIWESLSALISHPHDWIRKSSIRIFSLLSTYIDCDLLLVKTTSTKFAFIQDETNTISISRKLVSQLLREDLNDELAEYIVRGLFFLSKHIYSNEERYNISQPEEEDEKGTGSTSYLCRLVKRLCVMCRKASIYLKDVTNLMRKSVFQFYAAILSHVDGKTASLMSEPIIMILYITSEDETNHSSEALKSLAIEVMDLLQSKMGTKLYMEVFRKVEEHVKSNRQARKEKRALVALKHPEINVKRKVAKNIKEKDRKKRKIEDYRSKKVRVKSSIKASTL